MGSGLPTLIAGRSPELGAVFAAVDPQTAFVRGELRSTRLSAWLAPFRSRAAALSALEAAGATEIEERVG